MNLARLIIASSESSSDFYWATRFQVPDPMIFIEHRGRKLLVASDLEYSRAKKEAQVDEVLSHSDYERKLKKIGREKPVEADVLDQVLRDLKVRMLEVPASFPFRMAEILRRRGYRLMPVPDPFFPEREIKTPEEKKWITQALRITEQGIEAAITVLESSVAKKTYLEWNGTTLTSEILRRVIELKMMELGAVGRHTIVAGGKQAADPHCRGTGPLKPNETIVLDVFPRSTETGYHGDITRTVVKGRASDKLRKMYEAVRKAQEAGIRTVRAGIDGSEVHNKVAASLEAAGFKTQTLKGKPQGFIHSTGHGLGLDVHEAPRVSARAGQMLKKGHIVTVEPGLYYEDLGGIRIEDVVAVTATGCEVLTKIGKTLEIP